MKRTKLSDRQLPNYSNGEECMNMVTHIVGGGLAVLALAGCCWVSILHRSVPGIICGLIYSISMVALYCMSSIYHGLRPGMGKKVLQVLDHCTIYFLIAGTYTPLALVAIRPLYPSIGWGLTAFQWILAALAVTLTAIDLKKNSAFSMICYICMGWAVLPFMQQLKTVLGDIGFGFLLGGGIAYTLGAILYGIGARKHWFHSVFHIFVVLGSALHLICILFYVL